VHLTALGVRVSKARRGGLGHRQRHTLSSGVDRILVWPRPSSPAPAASRRGRQHGARGRGSRDPAVAPGQGVDRRAPGAGCRHPADGRPFHALDGAPAGAAQWERDPLFRAPLSIISSVYKIVHFDAARAAGPGAGPAAAPGHRAALGAANTPPSPDRRGRRVRRGGDRHRGRGGGRSGARRALATRWSVEEALYHRHSFDGSTVRATSASTGRCSPSGTPPSPSVGRMVGGSTAINGGQPSGRRTGC
jgi:hypothetical protein